MKVFFTTIALANICFFSLIFFLFPRYRDFLGGEDQLIETLTALLFLAAAIYCFVGFIKNKNAGRRTSWFLFGSLGLIGFLDELSFGERIFNLSMPSVRGVQIDAAHDFFELGFTMYRHGLDRYPVLAISLIVGALVVAGLIIYRFRTAIKNFIGTVLTAQSYRFLMIGCILVFVALVIDLEMIHNTYLFLLEELFEMNAAFALLLGSICIGREAVAPAARIYKRKEAKESVSI